MTEHDTQEALRVVLADKDLVIREVHHRTKNHLMLTTSLLRLEAGRLDHPTARTVLRDMQHRIEALAALHDLLQHSTDIDEVDLATHLASLARHIIDSLSAANTVQLHLALTPTVVPTRSALAFGLIVNELLTNSLKHGIPAGQSGDIWVRLEAVPQHAPESPSRLRLEIRDSGVGLPAGRTGQPIEGVGLQLVADLVRQLGGVLEDTPGPGARFVVEAPVTIREVMP